MHATATHHPWQQVTVDFMGPLPRSKRGNTWLLNMQDRFSKWVELRPLRRATAPAVTQAIAEDVILRHGCPESVISDNGTQFKSTHLAKLLQNFNIEHRLTPAYTPQCNPVERTYRTVKTMLAQYVERNHKTWDEKLHELRFAYNTARHDATGYTPAYLNHGRELLSPANSQNARRGPAPPPDTTRRHLEEAYEFVRMNLARAFQSKSNAFNAKLAPRFKGPLEVRRVVSPVIVDLRDGSGRWYRHVHVKDLKPAPPTPQPGTETNMSSDAEGEHDPDDSDNNNNTDDSDEIESNDRDDRRLAVISRHGALEKDQSTNIQASNISDYNEALVNAVYSRPALYDHRIPIKIGQV
ncbi:PREDICTED: uncharacterized protein K02A2.6-like [Trachymyrmex cornetzi]|uniref:uncharacterized protein K02A2.6-like n=1 Tax=Trachymyrmex cornetzi TaxID=471704 RepID=UPI00084F524E|nr:PREDICTED: uncharacterized protein K02A2.6-like [Trachymyrmex cornetzi]